MKPASIHQLKPPSSFGPFFLPQGVCEQLYKSPAKLKKHKDDLGSFFRALGFTSQVEHLLNFQKQLLIPELHEHTMVMAALADADNGHWNITNDLIYPACLEEFRRKHKSSWVSQVDGSGNALGTGGGGPTLAATPPPATSANPSTLPALNDHEISELVRDTLDQVYALCLETLQELGFIREVDRALSKSLMAKFIRLQLIVGDNLNTSLWAMHIDLEATSDELMRDMDIAAQHSTDLPSENPL